MDWPNNRLERSRVAPPASQSGFQSMRCYTVILGYLLCQPLAHATAVATEEEILCANSNIVVARVLAVTPKWDSCGTDVSNFDDCDAAGFAEVKVEIARVLAPTKPSASPRELMALSISLINGTDFGTPRPDGNGKLAIIPPTGKLITPKQANDLLLRKTFIFAYSPGLSGPGELPWASIYRLRRESWVRNELKSNKSCAVRE